MRERPPRHHALHGPGPRNTAQRGGVRRHGGAGAEEEAGAVCAQAVYQVGFFYDELFFKLIFL